MVADGRASDPARAAPQLVDRLIATVDDWQRSLPDEATAGGLLASICQSLEHLRHDVRRRTRVVLLGEFNSGKSTLANVLAHGSAVSTSVLANTSVPTLVHAAGREADALLLAKAAGSQAHLIEAFDDDRAVDHVAVERRSPLLDTCQLLDTPGLADPARAEMEVFRYAALADVAIWCTVAGQSWKASERDIWDALPPRLRARGLLVVTGADTLRSEVDRARLAARLEEETRSRFLDCHFVASRDALASLDASTGDVRDPLRWAASGAAALENAIVTLAEADNRRRRRRADRWAVRLLRRIGALPGADVARLWWLGDATAWSAEMRRIAQAARARRIGPAHAYEAVHAATCRFEARLVAHLSRLGRSDDRRELSRLLAAALAQLRRPEVLACPRRGLSVTAPVVFHDIARLMQPSARELVALQDLRVRLLALLNATAARAAAKAAIGEPAGGFVPRRSGTCEFLHPALQTTSGRYVSPRLV